MKSPLICRHEGYSTNLYTALFKVREKNALPPKALVSSWSKSNQAYGGQVTFPIISCVEN